MCVEALGKGRAPLPTHIPGSRIRALYNHSDPTLKKLKEYFFLLKMSTFK